MRRRHYIIILALCILLALGIIWPRVVPYFVPVPTSTPTLIPEPTPTSWPIRQRLPVAGYGVNVHMWWDPWAPIRRDWSLVQDAGFRWVKQRLSWMDVEEAGPGHYAWDSADRIVDEAERVGLNLIFRVDRPPAWAIPYDETTELPTFPTDLEAFGSFCRALAERYAGRVRGYQIWNEPNLAREWEHMVPDPVGYTELLRTCYLNIKAADPEALVISAGLAPTGTTPPIAIPDTDYLVAMYEAGASPYFDVLGLNAPGYKAPPEVSPDEAADPERGYGGQRFFCFRHVEDMRAIMERYGDGHKQVAILEFGWHTNTSPAHPDYAWFGVAPEMQGDYLVRAFRYAREHWSPWIGTMFVWNFPDSHWTPDNEEFWWGIVDPFWWGFDGENIDAWEGAEVRPAFDILQQQIGQP